jgi:amino acid adenylation domain-containing protein
MEPFYQAGPPLDLPDRTIDRVFVAAAAMHGSRPALLNSRDVISYDALRRDAMRWAARIGKLRIRPEEPIAIIMARGAGVAAPILGILQAGGAYVPLDPTWPGARLESLIEDCGARVIVTDGRARISAVEGRVLLETGLEIGDEMPASVPEPQARSPLAAAYVLYTSGSTGTPKGALGHHQGTLNRLRWMWSEFPFRDDDVMVQKAPLAFGDSIWELFGGLLCGVPTLYVTDDELADLPAFVALLERYRVTRLVVIPALLRVLLAENPPGLDRVLRHLRLVVTSGEALPPDIAERFLARSTATLLNLYGSIETAADATWYEVPRGPVAGPVPIGVPIANAEIRVLDSSLQAVSPGAAGELYVSGPLIARGYSGRARETALRFLPCPDGNPGTRMFRTGDLVRWDPPAGLHFLGRADHQVKIRGMRVELGEIEAALHELPGIARVVVVCAYPGTEYARLAAFIELNGPALGRADLNRYLAARLPSFMIPGRFIFRTLPRTATGKIDRIALARLAEEAPRLSSESPQGETESALSRFIAEVLGVDYIGRHDDFFELGGDSLAAMRIAARASVALGNAVRARDLLVHTTVAALASYLRSSRMTIPAPVLRAGNGAASLEAIVDSIEAGRTSRREENGTPAPPHIVTTKESRKPE